MWLSRLVNLDCFWRAGEKGTSFLRAICQSHGIFFRIKYIIQKRGGCNQGGISGAQRCFRSPKELGNKNLKELRETILILISLLSIYLFPKEKLFLWFYHVFTSFALLLTDSLFGLWWITNNDIKAWGYHLCLCYATYWRLLGLRAHRDEKRQPQTLIVPSLCHDLKAVWIQLIGRYSLLALFLS